MVAPGGKTPRNKLTAEQQKMCLDAFRRERRTRRARGNDAQEAKTTDQGTEWRQAKGRQIRKKRGNKPKPPSPSPPQSSQPSPSQAGPLQAGPGPGAPSPSPEPHAVEVALTAEVEAVVAEMVSAVSSREALTPSDARPSQPGRPPALKATEKSQRTCSERSKKRYRSVLQDESGSGSDVEQASTARPPPPLA